MTEIFRAGIQAMPRGQLEAAQALGMPNRMTMRRIILPQAIRIVTPAIGNEFIAMIKDSALVSIMGVQELLWRAQRVGTVELPGSSRRCSSPRSSTGS
jgi:ABC-type amino acid transport system permease subunit